MLEKVNHIHFMGIGGSGSSATAGLALAKGFSVSGCDIHRSIYTSYLRDRQVLIYPIHHPSHLEGVDLLAISRAVKTLNYPILELSEARKRGIPIVQWQEVLAELMTNYLRVGVSGTHGKGTATALIATILTEAGFDPTFESGAIIRKFGTNFRAGKGKHFVFEADEYGGNFLFFHPQVLVVNNIEYDHPDYFHSLEEVVWEFEKFIRGMKKPSALVVNSDSPGVQLLLTRLSGWEGKVVTYGVETFSDFKAAEIVVGKGCQFKLTYSSEEFLINLSVPGKHNVYNALGAIAATRFLDVPIESIISSLASFGGIEKRFDIKGEFGGVTLIDDYAHHPGAIKVTLETTREVFPNRRIWVVFQPHLFSRTKALFDEFVEVFSQSSLDFLIVTDIFAAREEDTGLIHAKDLAGAVSGKQKEARYSGSLEDVIEFLFKQVAGGDVVVVMGAGDVYKVTEKLMEKLKSK
jgi:UDP-N-acetylmuramate--alanine ligase